VLCPPFSLSAKHTLFIKSTMFKPIIIGGQDISSLRAIFDHDDKRIIVPTNRQLIYYNIESGCQDGVANISPNRLSENEVIASCTRLDMFLYLFTNYGKIFIWSLETHDWTNEMSLPFNKQDETLLACKMPSKRQYLYTTRNNLTGELTLYHSMSRSERERPKQLDFVGNVSNGDETSFDLGCRLVGGEQSIVEHASQVSLSNKVTLAFIHLNRVYFQRVNIGEELKLKVRHQVQDLDLTCVRANPTYPMVATGDIKGRIYLYTGELHSTKLKNLNRTKLHWHHGAINDLCFSSTGLRLYSAGRESGCIVIWDLAANTLGGKKVVPALGMPIRHINCSPSFSFLAISSEDNEIRFMNTDATSTPMKTLTRRTYDMYLRNDPKAMRFGYGRGLASDCQENVFNDFQSNSIGLLWHSKTDSVVTNAKTGRLQFYSTRLRATVETLDCLKSSILSLDNQGGRVLPSEITRAALSSDGDWLAFYETRKAVDGFFPEVKLHIWQRSSSCSKWFWIQTADRLHSTSTITDLKFSPDGQYLVSVGEDGRFQVLHRVSLDLKSPNKQMYAKGFFGNVPGSLPSLAAFSQDSSVLAISLKNENTLIWMIVDPYKLEYECQLNREDSDDIEHLVPPQENRDETARNNDKPDKDKALQPVLGLHFGRHEPSKSIAPLCEVRAKYIRIWNILNAQSSSAEMMEYLATDGQKESYGLERGDEDGEDEFTAAAFDSNFDSDQTLEHFAVGTKKNLIYLFELKINQDSRKLQPLLIIDGSLQQINNATNPRYYLNMCFVKNPILDIDEKSHQDPIVVKLINRLCLMTNEQELVGFTDKFTVERELAVNSCNDVKTYELGELQEYFIKTELKYQNEMKDLTTNDEDAPKSAKITMKQRRIKQRLEVQKMLKDLFDIIPSHNLPRIEILGPMIIDKLAIE